MNIDELYQQTIDQLRGDRRAHLTFNQAQSERLRSEFHHACLQADTKSLTKILCLLEHAQVLRPLFDAEFLMAFAQFDHRPDLLILLLGTFKKQAIEARQKNGERLPFALLQALERLIEHPHPEVFEWVVRTIESMGSQSLYFQKILRKKRPNFLTSLNRHNKNAKMIIDLMLKKWGHFER